MIRTISFKIINMGMMLLLILTCSSLTSNLNQSKEKGFTKIFDGKTLKGWDGDPAYWRVENGCLVGEVTPTTLLKTNTFIIWRGGVTKDFELKGSFHITLNGNSGINYRSEQLKEIPFALKGIRQISMGKLTIQDKIMKNEEEPRLPIGDKRQPSHHSKILRRKNRSVTTLRITPGLA